MSPDKIVVIRLPLGFIYDHLLISKEYRNPFVQQASWFEDIVIRCVRYAFAYIPARIGRVFFSKHVALPFTRFRMIRHGYLRSPIRWKEIKEVLLPWHTVCKMANESDLERIYRTLDNRKSISTARYCHLLCSW